MVSKVLLKNYVICNMADKCQDKKCKHGKIHKETWDCKNIVCTKGSDKCVKQENVE